MSCINNFMISLFALLGLTLSGSLHAATIFVESQLGEPGCDLVDAIHSANNDASQGGCFALNSYGDDTIRFLIDDLVFDDTAATISATPSINSVIRIIGPDPKQLTSITRSEASGTPSFRFFTVGTAGELTLENLELINGDVTHDDPNSSYLGNAISVRGEATLRNVSIKDSQGGIGAVYTTGVGAFAPGVEAQYAKLTVFKSSFTNNYSTLRGGAMYISNYSQVTIFDSTFSLNSADAGGGALYIDGAETYVNIYNTTMAENIGGVSPLISSQGGAIFASSLTQSAEQRNKLIIRNSILSNNTAGEANEFYSSPHSSSFNFSDVTMDNNIIGHAGISTLQALANYWPPSSNILASSNGSDPTAFSRILGPLRQKNKSQSFYNPADGSPATDAGVIFRVSGGSPLTFYEPGCAGTLLNLVPPPFRTDQNDGLRPLGEACDIGAIEHEPSQCYVVPLANQKTVVFCL